MNADGFHAHLLFLNIGVFEKISRKSWHNIRCLGLKPLFQTKPIQIIYIHSIQHLMNNIHVWDPLNYIYKPYIHKLPLNPWNPPFHAEIPSFLSCLCISRACGLRCCEWPENSAGTWDGQGGMGDFFSICGHQNHQVGRMMIRKHLETWIECGYLIFGQRQNGRRNGRDVCHLNGVWASYSQL